MAVVSRQRWYIASAVVAAILVVAVVLVVWRPWRENRSASAPLGSPAPPEVTSMILSSVSTPPTPSASTTTVAPVALPSEPPPNAGCDGVVISHSDLEHPTLGTVRVFLFLTSVSAEVNRQGCVLPVARSGKVLPAIPIDGQERLGFANPATDATGNMFITYNPGRYDGVLVLIPDAIGFEDIGWDPDMSGTHYMGKHAYYYAELVGPDSSDQYTIRQSHNDCTPSCANGNTSSKDLRWNGSDYVA